MRKEIEVKMNKNTHILIAITFLVISGAWYFAFSNKNGELLRVADTVLAAKFEDLSQSGNSSCSATFKESILTMSDGARLQGSCCSQMSIHRYTEQVEGLQKFKSV